MPNEDEAEDRIKRAERLGFEFSEHAVAAELFPNLDFNERALLVGLRAQTEVYPDNPDDDEGLTGEIKAMTGIDYWAEKIRNSGLIGQLSAFQRMILKKRYADFGRPE